MHIAVFKNSFRQHACAVCHAQHRHELRLHVGGKAGIWRSRNGQWLKLPIRCNANAGAGIFNGHTRLT